MYVPSSVIHNHLNLSPPPTTNLPLLHNLSRRHETPTQDHRTSGKPLRAIILAPTAADESPRDRRAGERGEADNSKNHAHPRARLAQVRRQAAQPRGEEGLDPARGDAEEDGPRVQAGRVFDGDPGQLAYAGDDGRRHEDVEGAPAVGEVVWDQAADYADSIEEKEKVKGVNVGETDYVA